MLNHRTATVARRAAVLVPVALLALLPACRGSSQSAPPQNAGAAALSSAHVIHYGGVLVAEEGSIAIVARDGCLASMGKAKDESGSFDEMRVRCAREDRIPQWFDKLDAMISSFAVEKISDDVEIDAIGLPAAQLITKQGTVVRTTRKEDATRLAKEIATLSAELQAKEKPAPGPATSSGWQMLRVAGPAHAMFAGQPTHGTIDVSVSTDGQYLCEYRARTNEGPLRATKSGFLRADRASHAIEEILQPFHAVGPGDNPPTRAIAAAISQGTERRANGASVSEVIDRAAPLQDALGDACLPEIDVEEPVGN
jgi:hypothetical protein